MYYDLDPPISLNDYQFKRLTDKFPCRRNLYSGNFLDTADGIGSLLIYSRNSAAGVDDELVGVRITDGGKKREIFMASGSHPRIAVERILDRTVVVLFKARSEPRRKRA